MDRESLKGFFLEKCAKSMFYQTNREQDDLYIESIWLLQCPTANRWRDKARKRGNREKTIIYLACQQPTTS